MTFECLVCKPKAGGENVRHLTPPYRPRGSHSHEEVTNIIREGMLETDWWMLSMGMRLKLVDRVEETPGSLDWLRDLIRADGPARNAGKAYEMTAGRAFVNLYDSEARLINGRGRQS